MGNSRMPDEPNLQDEGNEEEDLEARVEAEIEAAIDAAIDAQREREEELAAEMAEDWEHEEEPWADPAIRAGYEASLGAFIVEFNRLDNLLTRILQLTLGKVGKLEQAKSYRARGYGAKLMALELLQTNAAIQNLHYAPIEEMKKVGAIRNFLAHAHFEQNPFDGNYQLVPPKSDKPHADRHLKADAIAKWTVRASEACHRLGFCEMPYIFGGVDLS